MLVGVGTFFAQAAATGFVGHVATTDRGSASGIYLACYFFVGWLVPRFSVSYSTASAGRRAVPGLRLL
jgi:hypothetical protein